ncbi:OsmC family protein [Aestuariivivens marinum]|uniref:OsmC family protein n=1 Tax=Aestuariivivens marinum TaxID=2913555 RepID=UPI001F59540C|nr:OsmC family protein [Aestuariivivens marinum]
MKAEELKKIQAPIKEKYRKNSSAALITLRASGEIGKGISCKVDTGKAMVEAGLHPATGGTGMQACSGDLLLEALVACAGVTLSAVATALEFDMSGGRVKAEGDLDFRGTLGVDKEAKVGFKNIRLNFQLSTSESKDRIDTLLKLTERYCVVYQTLVSSTDLVTEIEIM